MQTPENKTEMRGVSGARGMKPALTHIECDSMLQVLMVSNAAIFMHILRIDKPYTIHTYLLWFYIKRRALRTKSKVRITPKMYIYT